MDEPDQLKHYIEKLETLGGLPTEEELTRLKGEHQLKPEDLKKLSMLVERHKDRAEIYRHRENVNGAIEELERAAQLSPRDARIHLNLAGLYKNRYENFGFLQKDRFRAEGEADRTLSLDPSLSEASNIKKEIEILHRRLHGARRKGRPVILVILALFLLATLILFSRRDDVRRWLMMRRDVPEDAFFEPEPSPPDPFARREIEAESYDFAGKNLNLHIDRSEVSPINDHWGYTLQGGLLSPGQVLGEASLLLRFWDGENNLLREEELLLVRPGDPPLLPGENRPLDHFFFLTFPPLEVKRVTLLPGRIRFLNSYEYHTREKKIRWQGERPEGIKLKWEERERVVYEGYDTMVHFYTADVTQLGLESIYGLDFTLEWKNRREETVQTLTVPAVQSGGPPMEGLEKRVLNFTLRTPLERETDSLIYEVYVSRITLSQASQ